MGSSLSQQSAFDIISHWRSRPAHELLFDSNSRDQEIYMQAVDRLQQSPNMNGFNELISIAMARLKREFHEVLSRQADYQAAPISTTEWSSYTDSTANAIRYEDYSTVYEAPNIQVIMYLRSIAERMNTSGKLGECVNLYKTVRKSFLQSHLSRLRFEELYIGDNPRRFLWDELKVKIEVWNQVSKICVRILFEREKQLCDQIFQGLGANVECFVGTVQEFAVSLFAFAEAMSLSNQSYERMEAILGLYDSFVSVLPNVNALFLSEPGEGIRNGCLATLSNIEIEVVRMLYDLQKGILYEVSDSSDDQRGAIHRSTKYAMENIDLIVRNKRMLTNLIKSTPSLNFDGLIIPQEDLGDTQNRNFLELQLILILVVLQRNIEGKSKFYKEPSLKYLFIMNNVRYIVQKIEGSFELQEMIGGSYLKKLNENVNLAMNGYQESTCSKFLNCLKDDGLYVTRCFKHGLSRTTLKKRIKAFNAAYEEIQHFHTFWTVPDLKLKEEICAHMSEKLVPQYKNFLVKFGSNPEFKALDQNIKYSVENFKALILEKLFAHPEVIV
ncbi:hypothetical protein ACJIZ3_025357 [Penstemon smallii]|uniref:Exocyst subunit Exo70 family protein n=1 Tax=Penstemon smallii TaxID=265156 RepID=A0ABD3TW22_9LAMI